LASRRLSIIDLAGGDQPIFNEDGTCAVVQNGEIYNHPDLMRELQSDGHVYRTHSDTETLVHLYEQHDLDFARRLRGMFAVAIWDARRRRLILARDRYGIKPLYYRAVGGTLEFASELRALPRGEIDLDALEAFLAFNSVPAPFSIFHDVRKLPAGQLLVWDGEVRLERYARPAPTIETRNEEEAELTEELGGRIRRAVRRLERAADLSGRPARRRGRKGRALRRRRRRVVRRLLHVRRRPVGTALRGFGYSPQAGRRAPPDLGAEGELRLSGE